MGLLYARLVRDAQRNAHNRRTNSKRSAAVWASEFVRGLGVTSAFLSG